MLNLFNNAKRDFGRDEKFFENKVIDFFIFLKSYIFIFSAELIKNMVKF